MTTEKPVLYYKHRDIKTDRPKTKDPLGGGEQGLRHTYTHTHT